MKETSSEKRPHQTKEQSKGCPQAEQEGPQIKVGSQEKERWALLLREAELIAALLKESGTRR